MLVAARPETHQIKTVESKGGIKGDGGLGRVREMATIPVNRCFGAIIS